MFLDNARYQKCSLVTTRAEELGINLVFLPPYSPNLNLIERLWKYVKKELRCSYFDNFNDFRGEIDQILRDTQGEKKEILEKLMGMNVQLFDELAQKSKISSEQPSNEKTMPKGKRRRSYKMEMRLQRRSGPIQSPFVRGGSLISITEKSSLF